MTDKHFVSRFAELLREVNAPKTRVELGKWLDVSPTMAHYYVTGEKLPSTKKAKEIAAKLGCCVEYLMTGEGPKRPPPDQSDLVDKLLQLNDRHRAIVATLIDSLLTAQAGDAAKDAPTDQPEHRKMV